MALGWLALVGASPVLGSAPGWAADGSTDGSRPGAGTSRPRGAAASREQDEARATYDAAVAGLDEATASRETAHRHVDELASEAREIQTQLDQLSGSERSAADRVAVARRHARELAVEAYVGGGPPSVTTYLAGVGDANDLAWRSWMVRDQVGRAYGSIDELARARQEVGRQADELARRLDRNRAARQAAQNDRERAERLVLEAEDRLADAEQRRRDVDETPLAERPRGYRGAGDDGSPTPDESGNAKGPRWAALRQCESSGNYNIVDSSGAYRGAYQFDLQTWRSVGGHGDPVDNTTAEQDLRAQILYDQRGPQPWPICGRHLRTPDDPAAVAPTVPDSPTSSSTSTVTTVGPASTSVPPPTPLPSSPPSTFAGAPTRVGGRGRSS